MKRVRTILFWGHLAAGVTAGSIILIMSATGALLAFQPQILARLERDVRIAEPSGQRLTADAVVAAAMAARPSAQLASIAIDADPRTSVSVNFGRDGMIYVDPYSGRVLGEGARTARAFFQSLTEWHRWLAMSADGRQTGRMVTGASNFAFLALAMSGFYLWMPRKWSLRSVRAVIWFQGAGTARARDFNWHNAIGFWCAPAIIVMSATALVLSYPWANRLVHQLAGTPLPPQQVRAAPAQAAANPANRNPVNLVNPANPVNLDRAIARATEQMPAWKTITLRVPPRPNGPLTLTLVDGAYWNAYARSTLTVDGATGAVAKWEPYTAQTRGQKWRGWIRFAHTGELGGVAAQAVAGAACLGGVFLVWTGLSLAIRRLAASRVLKKSQRQAIAASGMLLLTAMSSAQAEAYKVLIVPPLLSYGGIEQGIPKRLEGLAVTRASRAMVPDARVERRVLESAGLNAR